MKAWCSSTKCIGNNRSSKKVEKLGLVGKPDLCPDCGYYLEYGKDKPKMRVVRTTKIAKREKI